MYFDRTYHIFISHAWTADSDYKGVIDLLNKDSTFKYKNYSVPKSNPLEINAPTEIGRDRQLTRKISEQIRHGSVVIIIAGMYVKYRKWIQKEIDIAKQMNKPILVVRPRGAERIPIELYEYKMAYWNSTSIIKRIKEVVDDKITI